MGSKYRVSILIPCYNGSSFIDRSFKSILKQTEKGIEIIFVDDGSTDCSLTLANDYIDTFEALGHRLCIIHKSNGGAASAIKVALEVSSGKYIMPLDIDDELCPDSCKLQADYLDLNPDCGLVLTNGYRIFDDGHPIQTIRPRGQINNKSNIFLKLLSGTVSNVPGMYMIRGDLIRDYYRKHSFLITKYGQNLQLLMPSSYVNKAGYIELPLLKYHVHIGSHSNPGQYESEMTNLRGYLNIRIHILKEMNLKSEEYLNIVKQSFYEAALLVDAKYSRRKEYNYHFNLLKRYRTPTFQEKLEFYIINKSILQFYYRFCAKLGIK